MIKLITLLIKALPFIILMLVFTSLKSQNAPFGEGDFIYTIADATPPNCLNNQLDFDLFLLDTDPSQVFDMSAIQAGILVNPAIYGGGTITASVLAGYSQLLASQVPTTVTFTQSTNCVKLAARPLPGCGYGTLISTDPANPTRICRIRLTNTVAFAAAPPNFTFSYTTVPFPTKVAIYPHPCPSSSLQLTCNAANTYSVAANLPLNSFPLVYAVTDGGSYCAGGAGLPVGLGYSQLGITYTLYKNAVAQIPTVAGTGAAISFGNQLAGNYTVQGVGPCNDIFMTGTAVIIESPLLPDKPGTISGPTMVCQGATNTYSISAVSGATSYTWTLPSDWSGSSATTSINATASPGSGNITVTANNYCGPGPAQSTNVYAVLVPVQVSITNIIVSTFQNNCYIATQTVTVAGNNTTFIVQYGGSATMIAGQTISYLPGTSIGLGGYMHGYIATGVCCGMGGLDPGIVENQSDPDSIERLSIPSFGSTFFKVYPNPTSGNFILELNGDFTSSITNVEVFGMRGEEVLTTVLTGERKREFSLSDRPAGIYFIRVISGSKAASTKIIKQ
jgi:PKD-like domain/Secretion system C-terminal sorting domain